MVSISTEELIQFFQNNKGSHPATLVTRTYPKLRKNCPYSNVVKESRINVIMGFSYQNSVNNQREREDRDTDFIPLPLKWGHHIVSLEGKPLPVIEHKGETYLQVKVQKVLSSTYLVDDKPIDESEISPYLPDRKEGERQEVDNPVIVRTFKLDSIQVIYAKGCEITLKKVELNLKKEVQQLAFP